MDKYCSQKMRIRWNEAYFDIFAVCNGVKPGGVLSPLLFTIYLEELRFNYKHKDWDAIVAVRSLVLLSMLMTLLYSHQRAHH